MNRFLLLPLLILSLYATPLVAQMKLAAEKTAPFSAVRFTGDKTLVYVEGEWYEPLAINDMPAAHIIDYCKHAYKEKWVKRFSEDLVEVMQELDNPLYELVKLELLLNGQRLSKSVIVNEKKRKAAWEYNNLHNQNLVKTGQPSLATTSNTKKEATVAKEDKNKPFPVKTAMVEYIFTNNSKYAGKEVIHIKEHGSIVVVAIERPGTNGLKEQKTIVWHNNKTMEVDHLTKTYKEYNIRNKKTEPPAIAYLSEKQKGQGGYIKKGTEFVADKECVVYEHKNTGVTYWLWNGIDLKMEYGSTNTNFADKKVATAVLEFTKMPESLLSPPKGYTKK